MTKCVENIDGVEEGQPGELPPAAARAMVEQGVRLGDAVQAGVEDLDGNSIDILNIRCKSGSSYRMN